MWITSLNFLPLKSCVLEGSYFPWHSWSVQLLSVSFHNSHLGGQVWVSWRLLYLHRPLPSSQVVPSSCCVCVHACVCLCACVSVYLHVHLCVEIRGWHWISSLFFTTVFETGYLFEPVACRFDWTGWSESPRDSRSTAPTIPQCWDFRSLPLYLLPLTQVLRVKLRSFSWHDKHCPEPGHLHSP